MSHIFPLSYRKYMNMTYFLPVRIIWINTSPLYKKKFGLLKFYLQMNIESLHAEEINS